MLVGEVFLETMASGIITQEEIDWLTTHQASFSREEEAMALKIGRLLDEGSIQIGCRLLGKEDSRTTLPSCSTPADRED
jgi:3-oxoacyl-[acyl-carrier-protein] synthase III